MLRPAAALSLPPDPLVPLPALTTTAPPRPPVAAPLPSSTAPLFPPAALPELNSTPASPRRPAIARPDRTSAAACCGAFAALDTDGAATRDGAATGCHRGRTPRSARPASDRHHNGTSTSPSGRARAHGQTPTVPRYRRPRTKRERPARARRSAIRRADDNSAAARRGALPGRERDAPAGPRRAAASSKIRSAARSAVPLPALTLTAPPRPPDAAPEPIEIPPPFPLLAEPELNASSPHRAGRTAVGTSRDDHRARALLRPFASADRNVTSRRRRARCRTQATTPHRRCSSRCRPRRSRRRCPPTVAGPDPIVTVPLLPADELPELNARRPLAPDAPPFAARTATIPLLVCVPLSGCDAESSASRDSTAPRLETQCATGAARSASRADPNATRSARRRGARSN